MEHVNDWCFRDIYKGGLWDDDLHVCAHLAETIRPIFRVHFLGHFVSAFKNGIEFIDFVP